MGHSVATGEASKKVFNDNDTSCESEVEVNMKDYYVIRHETVAKSVSGPIEIDFGYAISHQSFLKGGGGRGKKFVKKRKSNSKQFLNTPVFSQVQTGNTSGDNNSTDVEDLAAATVEDDHHDADDEKNNSRKLMTYQEFLESLKISRSDPSCFVQNSTCLDDNTVE